MTDEEQFELDLKARMREADERAEERRVATYKDRLKESQQHGVTCTPDELAAAIEIHGSAELAYEALGWPELFE